MSTTKKSKKSSAEKPATKRVGPKDSPLCVEVRECKENKMFSKEQHDWTRFLLYSRPVPCAECGRMAKVMWTMLCQFVAPTLGPGMFKIDLAGCRSHLPLTPVCDAHPLAVRFPEDEPSLVAAAVDVDGKPFPVSKRMLLLARAVREAISKGGEFNAYTSERSLRDVRRLATNVLKEHRKLKSKPEPEAACEARRESAGTSAATRAEPMSG